MLVISFESTQTKVKHIRNIYHRAERLSRKSAISVRLLMHGFFCFPPFGRQAHKVRCTVIKI